MDGGGPKITCADAQFPQTPAEGVGLFHLARGDHAEEGLVEHTFLLAEMVHLVLWRLNLQQLFHGAVVPECVVCDGPGEQRQDWIAKKRSGLQALVHGVFWPVHPVSKKAVRSPIIPMGWRRTFSPASKSYSSHPARLESRTPLSRFHFERRRRSYPAKGDLSLRSRPLEGSLHSAEGTHSIIEAATGTSAARGLDVFPHSRGSEHIKLDLCPRVHSYPRLVVNLPVFLPKLRSQMDKVVGGTVAPDPFSMRKAQFYSQGFFDELHDSQPRRLRQRGTREAQGTNVCDGQSRCRRYNGVVPPPPGREVFPVLKDGFFTSGGIIVDPVDPVRHLSHKVLQGL